MNQIPCCGWLPEWARWPGTILLTRECPFCSRNKMSPKSKRVHEFKVFLRKIFSVKTLKIFCDFSVGMELDRKWQNRKRCTYRTRKLQNQKCQREWKLTASRSVKTQKENLANIQPSWPHPWSIIYIYVLTSGALELGGRGLNCDLQIGVRGWLRIRV